VDAERAAELGPVGAVLRWERFGPGFPDARQAVIATQLRRCRSAAGRRHRITSRLPRHPMGTVRPGVRRSGISHPRRRRPRMSRGGKPRAPAESHVGPVGRGCGGDRWPEPGRALVLWRAPGGHRMPSAERHDTNIDIDSADDGACWWRISMITLPSPHHKWSFIAHEYSGVPAGSDPAVERRRLFSGGVD